MRKIGMI